MNSVMKIMLFAVAIALMPYQIANAVLTLSKIQAPEDCPDGLTIKTTAKNGMIEFDVSIDVEKIANAGELYKGRVKSKAHLDISMSPEQKLAYVQLQGMPDSKPTRYHFSVAPPVIKSSKLYLSTSLFEKDGDPTLGGGVTIEVQLEGFGPKASGK
jgi:hypothetical protein